MLIKINPSSTEPLFAQVVASIRGGITSGDITSGERLPSARELASSLGVNMHTVLRAYNDLRDMGLIELRRGRGAVVTGVTPCTADVDAAVAELVQLAVRHGLSPNDVHHRIDTAWSAHAPPTTP